jgi:hypothetical protein
MQPGRKIHCNRWRAHGGNGPKRAAGASIWRCRWGQRPGTTPARDEDAKRDVARRWCRVGRACPARARRSAREWPCRARVAQQPLARSRRAGSRGADASARETGRCQRDARPRGTSSTKQPSLSATVPNRQRPQAPRADRMGEGEAAATVSTVLTAQAVSTASTVEIVWAA